MKSIKNLPRIVFVPCLLALLILPLLASTSVLADEPGYPWQDHAPPFDFIFGNLIDNHQQSKLVGPTKPVNSNSESKLKRQAMLQGFIYIQFTGDTIDGVPVAVRADCTDPSLDCRVGWKIKGIPFNAKLVSTGPRLWEVDESLLPSSPNYVHFHWTGSPKRPCGLQIEETYSGYLLQRTAVTEFYWLGGNPNSGSEGHLVSPGIDLHSNIVTDWEPGDGGGSGGHGGGSGGHDDGGCGGHDDDDHAVVMMADLVVMRKTQ